MTLDKKLPLETGPHHTFWQGPSRVEWDLVSGLVFLPKTDTTNVSLPLQWKSSRGHGRQPQRTWQSTVTSAFSSPVRIATTVFHLLVTSIPDYLNALSQDSG